MSIFLIMLTTFYVAWLLELYLIVRTRIRANIKNIVELLKIHYARSNDYNMTYRRNN